jgi:hypothetical protein
MSACTVRLLNPRSPRRPYAEHAGLTAAEAQELARIYHALGHDMRYVHVAVDAGRPGERAA